MLRPVITVAAFALAVYAVGCGDDGGASPADSVRAYNDAVADGDGDKACDQLTEAAQEELQQATQGRARGSCKQVIELLAAFYDDATKEKLRDAKVASSAQGDRGSARFSAPSGLGGPPREQTYELEREGEEWKITSLGLSGPDPGIPSP